MTMKFDRRTALIGAGSFGALVALPRMTFAAMPTDKRLVFIIQRGAADGLAIVPPLGDPKLSGLRGALANDDAIKLDAMFGLHSALANTAGLFAVGEGRAYHAVATAYRDRSHFDGQNMLESGASRPYGSNTGWLGRLLPMIDPEQARGLAIAPAVPLALRGDLPVATFAPNRLPDASDDLLMRLSYLYGEDALLAPLWDEAIKTKDLAGDIGGNSGRNGGDLGKLAARLMAPANGARVMMIETGGWDTHSNQVGRLDGQLRGLDQLLAALKNGLGPSWQDTLVVVATEFGRTAAVNGTAGTDHGTASAMLLLGGSLPYGAPVVSDWPGLGEAALYEGRDLMPTNGIGDIVSGAVARHFALDPELVAQLFAA